MSRNAFVSGVWAARCRRPWRQKAQNARRSETPQTKVLFIFILLICRSLFFFWNDAKHSEAAKRRRAAAAVAVLVFKFPPRRCETCGIRLRFFVFPRGNFRKFFEFRTASLRQWVGCFHFIDSFSRFLISCCFPLRSAAKALARRSWRRSGRPGSRSRVCLKEPRGELI